MLKHNFVCYLSVLIILFGSTISKNNTLLLIVSFDGFRFDYFNRNLTKTLVELRKNSSYPPYMTSVFPSKTFTNHFSIATGLYTEVHGVLDNIVFDRSLNKTLGYGYELFHYNEDIVPLWTLNERSGGGRRSGCMMWPSCNFKYQDTLPSHSVKFNTSVNWEDRVDTLLEWFKHPETPINLGMLYFEQPDAICHIHGPDSPEVNEEIARVDRIAEYLLKQAENAELLSRLNIVFISDHGGQAVQVPQNIINLDDFVNNTWYKSYGVPPNLQIYPVEGKEAQVLEGLRGARKKTGGNFSTHLPEELPERWHYRHCARSPPILVTADTGFLFTDTKFENGSSVIGNHGYDPLEPSMRAFFMALGPLFKKNFTIEPFENINIYPLAAHMLGLALPALAPNGSLSQLQDILVTQPTLMEDRDDTAFLVAGLVIVTACVIMMLSYFIIRNHLQHRAKMRKSSIASYMVLNQGADDETVIEVIETLSSECEDDSLT